MQHIRPRVQELVTHISAFLSSIADINVARHVDVDGVRPSGTTATNDHYARSVEDARRLVRELETVVQAVYDDSSALLLTSQSLPEDDRNVSYGEREASYDYVHRLSLSLRSNLGLVKQTFDHLLSVGRDQAELAQSDYNGSIERRAYRLSHIPAQVGGAVREQEAYQSENDEVVDFGTLFTRPGAKNYPAYDSYRTMSNDVAAPGGSEASLDSTLVTNSTSDPLDTFDDNDDIDGKEFQFVLE